MKIKVTSIHVNDQEKALRFYTEVLGFVKKADFTQGPFRWLTVASWLHFTPLLAIPFAIVACLIAGLLLGAPTLRLRGDYLAIVTLGYFGLGVPPPTADLGSMNFQCWAVFAASMVHATNFCSSNCRSRAF